MESWARVYGGIGIVAAIVIFIALIYGIWQENLKFGTDTFEQFVGKDKVLFFFTIAGAVMFYSGIMALIDGMKTERSWATIYGIVFMVAGAMFVLIFYGHGHSITSSAVLSWYDGIRYLCMVFMALAAVACAREAADKCYGLAAVDSMMLVFIALAFYVDTEKDFSFLKGFWFPIAIAISVLVVSITPVGACSNVAKRKVAAAERERERDARIIAVLKAEDEAEAAKRQAELQMQFEARKVAQKKAKAEEKVRQEAAATAAKKAVEETAAKKAVEEEAARKAMEEQRAIQQAVEDEAERKCTTEVENRDREEVHAKYEGRLRDEEMDRRAAEERVANEVAEASVSKIAAVATPEPETRTEEVLFTKDETLGLTLQDLGIEKETPTTFVRRASWNKGLRCRRNYGLKKIPVAFVRGKVAVFVDSDGSSVDASRDEALEEDGWKVLHFCESDVTDGEAQADVIAAAVKENLRAEKAAKSKAAKKKA